MIKKPISPESQKIIDEFVDTLDCPYCTSDNEAIRDTYFDQTCHGCAKRLGAIEEATLPADILALCRARGWNLHWTHRGAYLHLESSELIEALRGKRGDPLHEAADVLLVLMSITENAGIPWSAVMKQARATCEELKTRPRYAGEEFDATAASIESKSEEQ